MMKQQTESCVPPGFRFHPTDEELVGYYLRKKVAAHKIDLDVIKDIDLYRIEPWDLPEKCRIGYEEEKEWYFFSHKDKKYPTGTRTNRATIAGFWKATGRDKAVYDHHHHANKSSSNDNNVIIGMRKTLVFYRGRAPNGHKTDWIMHEYRLESQEISSLQEEGWVVCRAFKKRATTCQPKNTETWDASNYYHESTTAANNSNNTVMNPNDQCMMTWQQQNFLLTQNFLCKQESTSTTTSNLTTINNSFMNPDSFVHLPPLANPSLPPDDRQRDNGNKVTDWRSLDKFVASQLSNVDHNDDLNSESLDYLQMQIGKEEYLWNSIISDRGDQGIPVFHQ